MKIDQIRYFVVTPVESSLDILDVEDIEFCLILKCQSPIPCHASFHIFILILIIFWHQINIQK